MVEFTNAREFEAWLQDKPREWAAVLAARAALRVLPLIANQRLVGDRDFAAAIALPVFRANALAQAAARYPAYAAGFSADAADDAAGEAAYRARTAKAAVPAIGAAKAAVAVIARSTDAFVTQADVASRAVDAVFVAAQAASVGDVWRNVSLDAGALNTELNPHELSSMELWNDTMTNRISLGWQRLGGALLGREEKWEVWLDWYLRLLHGRQSHSNPDAARVIDLAYVVMDSDDWGQGPPHVNALIKQRIKETLDRHDGKTGSPDDASTEEDRSDLTIKEFIVDLLERVGRPLTISQIEQCFRAVGRSSTRDSIRGRINTLKYEGRILRVGRGLYASLDHATEEGDSLDPGPDEPPEVPQQTEGLAYGISDNGKIGFARTGLATDDDIVQIEAIRHVLIEALDDLVGATEGSNAFATIHRIAERYHAVVAKDVAAISIDQLYAHGIRLDNARHRLTAEIARGDVPDTGIVVGEALDSVLAIHGPIVLSTRRGQELLALSREYNVSRDDDLAYRERGLQLAEAVAHSEGLVEPEVEDTIASLNADIGEGRFPERSSDTARRANQNLLVTIARAVLAGSGTVVGAGFLLSAPGQASTLAISELFNSALLFLQSNQHELRMLASIAGQELSWLTSFLDWLERQRNRRHASRN